MCAFGYWYGTLKGGAVINNVRWGKKETFKYCFDGIPKNSIVAVGTYSCIQSKENKYYFRAGLEELTPKA